MMNDETFQKHLSDLFCLWHGVRRHNDPPLIEDEEEKSKVIMSMLCRLLTEIEIRKEHLSQYFNVSNTQDLMEEWTMLTWNVLCINSRLQNLAGRNKKTPETVVYSNRLNQVLVDLVNMTNKTNIPGDYTLLYPNFLVVGSNFEKVIYDLHQLYQHLLCLQNPSQQELTSFYQQMEKYAEDMYTVINMFKHFCNDISKELWYNVRQAQIHKMITFEEIPEEVVHKLVYFYSQMMYRLAVLSARLQGFKFEMTINKKILEKQDLVVSMCNYVFFALELLMSDCILATEPATNGIFVTNNLFPLNCGALARGVVFKQFDIQVVTEEAAEIIQNDIRKQKMLQHPHPISGVPSAALLAMKPTNGIKRSNNSNDSANNTAHKKSDVNSKEFVTIYPIYNNKFKYWSGTYPYILCTTRQKGRHSTNNSTQDLSSNILDMKSHGKRPIFYFHIKATMFSPSGTFADAHTLSLPFTIATRRNQDCQVQRMMSSYTATCFWLYGSNVQDGLLLNWSEKGMTWLNFKHLLMLHFKVNAEVVRGLHEKDLDLFQYKLLCNDCVTSSQKQNICGPAQVVTFKNLLCPHLRYECGSTNVRFSVWRGMLEVLQIFQDTKNNVKKLWEKYLIWGFLEFDQIVNVLENYESALIMRLSFVTGGTICFTVKSNTRSSQYGTNAPIHLEPLDLKKLNAKCLKDYLSDIAVAENVKYIVDSNLKLIEISSVLKDLSNGRDIYSEIKASKDVSSNVTHSGNINEMQHIRFTAMRIAVVTCKVKPPSDDYLNEEVSVTSNSRENFDYSKTFSTTSNEIYNNYSRNNRSYNLTSLNGSDDDFKREMIQLCNNYRKSKKQVIEILSKIGENNFVGKSPSPTMIQPPISHFYSNEVSHIPKSFINNNFLSTVSDLNIPSSNHMHI
uniref:Protein kinase domain-containing protein n=1 Tax=Strongyloides papillosus TaxID=174720 RepID=A0A0N5C901_STREA